MSNVANVTIRPATPGDVPLILALVRELAEFEKLPHWVTATEDAVREGLFGERPFAEVLVADAGGAPAGFALFLHNFSTFLARPGLYLEDLYVRPVFRRQGIGRALLTELAAIATERSCGRFEWMVLDWNEGARRFYESLGAEPLSEWTTYRMTGAPLEALGSLGRAARADRGRR